MRVRRVIAAGRGLVAARLLFESLILSLSLASLAWGIFPKPVSLLTGLLGFLWFPLRLGELRAKRVAWALEDANPQLRERLVSWVELGLRELAQALERERFRLLPLLKPRKRLIYALLAGLSAAALRVASEPHALLSYPLKTFVLPERYKFFGDQGVRVRVLSALPLRGALLRWPGGWAPLPEGGEAQVSLRTLPAGTLRLEVVKGGRVLGSARVVSVERPFVEGVEVEVKEPSYFGGRARLLQDPPEIVAPEGSWVSLKVKHTGDSLKVLVNEKLAGRRFRLAESGEIEFVLFKNGLKTKSPRAIKLNPIPDLPPAVRIAEPPADVFLPRSSLVRVRVLAEDDFGLSRIGVRWRFKERQEGRFQRVNGLTAHGEFEVDLRGLGLWPGDEVELWAEASDIKGQVSKSLPLRIRVPTLKEAYQAAQGELGQTSEGARGLAGEAGSLGRTIRRLKEELRANPRLSWSQREALKQALEEAEALARKAEEFSREASARLRSLREAALSDPELLEKLGEIERLLNQVMNPELEKALRELQEALRRLNKWEIERALENLQLSQEVLKENLERTAELLRRYSQELKLRELAERARDLARRQGELKANPDPKAQEALAKEIEALKKETEALARELKGEPEAEALEKLAQQELSEAARGAREAAARLSSGKPAGAQQSQAQRELQAAASKLQSLGFGLTARRKREIIRELAEIRQELVFALSREGPVDTLRGQALRDAAFYARQRLKALARKTALVPPKAFAHLLAAERLAEMGRFREIKPELALATLALWEAQEDIQSSSCSAGFAEAMRKLAQAAQAQGALNSQTQSLLNLGLNPQELRQRLAALAAQQEAIRKMLEGVKEALKNHPQARGAVEGAQKEMEETERLMRQGKAGRELKERQERIMVRLLEAQQSIRERQQDPRRQAQQAKPYSPASPPPVKSQAWREKLLKIKQEEELWRLPPLKRRVAEGYLRKLLEQ